MTNFLKNLQFSNLSSILLFSFFSLILISSCKSNDDQIDENLVNTYKEIIIARETYKDVNEANLEVAKILKKYNLTEEEFRKELFDTMVKNKNFTKFIDSVKSEVMKELK